MKSFARHQLILDRVALGDSILIEDLVTATGASSSTVRRDIRLLEEAGRVVSLRGGAIRAQGRGAELPAAAKSLINHAEKVAIARAAASLVVDGDTIYVDSGTSLTEFMLALTDVRAHVITSNTQVLALVPPPAITVTALGGDYLPDIGSVAGTMTDRQLDELYFDRAFIGVTGIHAQAGVTTFDVREANKKRIVQAHSRETFVLADSSKFDVISLCRSFSLADCVVVSDSDGAVLSAAASSIIAPTDKTAATLS
ncbi:DeoR/GlpR family DNA-binding transcription regulator [Rathayibacter sp. SD072]|uniref:DeoR/GlpR family DNA-binding transcription regulator n=1 Tax=Rathayibacter sp. SD072 TaxID=2781731 RepID=UPI001A95ADED|nr:DeoR/GlpR family DNA-binding transcription regulator [Rathayibacter sp. SD072]MBO0985506.1 DeoR/GlpR transcriptional regulator [Rathayibacter sp. SD072]